MIMSRRGGSSSAIWIAVRLTRTGLVSRRA
jgi:hypothetical protein